MRRIRLFDFSLCDSDLNETIGIILDLLDGDSPQPIYFVNAHCVNLSYRDDEYRRILQEAPYLFADGVGMALAARWTGTPLRDNVNGTDLYPLLCEALGERGARLYLLGAKPGVAERMAERARSDCPGLVIAGAQHGYFEESETPTIIRRIREASPDVVLVALGAPRQEKWIHWHLGEIGAKAVMGVGGLFDFYSGDIPRAPVWMRRIGLEWCFRMAQEPRRLWKRYLLGNIIFLANILRHANKSTGAQN